ncbi:GNAT family N-acetyltransferase [Natranaeroarchaeum sulfidigenes]|uniref:Acetyltransferase (GNAT) family n=1 Tax=Natranaeroarchaeum sulfidigenes TaxID=2784880 RepID=A0A897MQX5_9EURY|nr:GNAT family N-acetyltransferase [Natranaeroarchaeum sulfidigenes]QSG02937.1 Acetyltransferase (GNAT) family [Natranaeroarchaeum sulfidigenes]
MTTIDYISETERFSDGIRELLVAADDEFVPRLSAREGTTQREGLADASSADTEDVGDAIESYHSQCLDQHLIACHDRGDIRGFMSFREGYRTSELEGYQPSNYISTVIVSPDYRRRGFARKMYKRILSDLPPGIECPYVTTRTWSTNHSHLSLLEELGFENVTNLPDDRGDGIDTVYYAIER